MTTIPHIVHGKPTTHGHFVHYTDAEGASHAALITNIFVHPSTGNHHANLHVFHRENDQVTPIRGVPHDIDGGPRTWAHLPY